MHIKDFKQDTNIVDVDNLIVNTKKEFDDHLIDFTTHNLNELYEELEEGFEEGLTAEDLLRIVNDKKSELNAAPMDNIKISLISQNASFENISSDFPKIYFLITLSSSSFDFTSTTALPVSSFPGLPARPAIW